MTRLTPDEWHELEPAQLQAFACAEYAAARAHPDPKLRAYIQRSAAMWSREDRYKRGVDSPKNRWGAEGDFSRRRHRKRGTA